MKPRALVIEPNFSGHRWRYVEWTIEALIEAQFDCTLATDALNREHPLVQSYRRDNCDVSLVWHGDDAAPRSAARGMLRIAKDDFAFHRLFASTYRTVASTQRIDLVVVPYGDYLLKAVALVGSPFGTTPWMCITMRQFFHLREMRVSVPHRPLIEFVKKRLFMRALRIGNLSTVLSIDPTLVRWHASSSIARAGPRIEYLADPYPAIRPVAQSAAKARLGITAERSILVYGAISERKGISELLDACVRLDDPPLIIIAGQQDERVRSLLAPFKERLAGRILILDQFITAETEVDLFSACDAVWLGYKEHYGMSGVLVQAYRFGKTAISTSAGLIGWFARHDELGPLLDDLCGPTIVAAIKQLQARWNAGADQDFSRDRTKLLAQNTVQNFKHSIGLAAAFKNKDRRRNLWVV
jgi:glycosyltransferase involved in cell wall biosynthesis